MTSLVSVISSTNRSNAGGMAQRGTIVNLTPLGDSGPGGGDTSTGIGRTRSTVPDTRPAAHSRVNSRVTLAMMLVACAWMNQCTDVIG